MNTVAIKWFQKPENLFLVIGLVCGVLYLIVTPPFQVADEDLHFYRAFQVAEGRMISTVHEGSSGGWLPENVKKAGSSTSYMRMKRQNTISRAEIISLFQMPLNINNRTYVVFRSSVYTPVAYLPAAAVIRIGIWCKLSPVLLMYLGRMANLICWLLLVWISIRIIPFFKWFFFVLALSPMSVYQAASLSADSMTNGLAFLTIAYFAYWIYDPDARIKGNEILLFFLLTISLSCTKNIFFPVSFLFLLIPRSKFENKHTYGPIFLALAMANMAACLVWYGIVKKMPITWRPEVFPDQQVTFILTHPITYVEIFLLSLSGQVEIYAKTFIGQFGWLDTPLTKWHYYAWGALLLLPLLTDGSKKVTVLLFHRMIYFSLFGVMYTGIITLLYVYWNTVGADKIVGVQGRYFIPIAPLFFLCLYNRRFSFNSPIKPVVIVLGTIISSLIALSVIYQRFYET